MRLVSTAELAIAVVGLAGRMPALTNYHAEMLDHPTAGQSLRNYIALSECPTLLADLTADERFWNRYYWLARFAREWQSAEGYDAGLEQSVFKLLESGARCCDLQLGHLAEVDAKVARDAVA
jgi:hypothetical protein